MTHLLRRSLLALACGLVVLVPFAARPHAAGPVVILFVGNSFFHGAFQPVRSYGAATVTDENAGVAADSPRSEGREGPYGGIPAIFKTLTNDVGLNYEVHSELSSGKSLEFHYTNALDVIAQAKWNVVVMHDYSTGPVPAARTGKPELFTKYADLLESAIHHANAAADVYLYETWARADLTYKATGPYHGEPIELMGHDLHDGYYGEFAHNGHFKGLAPAGDAWLRAISEGVAEADPTHPDATKINLWAVDSYHPSIYGAYLNALVLLEQITGKDPRTLGGAEQAAADLKIPPHMATELQRIAHDQVQESKRPQVLRTRLALMFFTIPSYRWVLAATLIGAALGADARGIGGVDQSGGNIHSNPGPAPISILALWDRSNAVVYGRVMRTSDPRELPPPYQSPEQKADPKAHLDPAFSHGVARSAEVAVTEYFKIDRGYAPTPTIEIWQIGGSVKTGDTTYSWAETETPLNTGDEGFLFLAAARNRFPPSAPAMAYFLVVGPYGEILIDRADPRSLKLSDINRQLPTFKSGHMTVADLSQLLRAMR